MKTRFTLDLFALGSPLVLAIQVDQFKTVPDGTGGQFDFRPGAIYIDPVIIALALANGVKYHIPGPIVIGPLGSSSYASAYVTMGGTIHTGDVINVTINGHALASGYTVVAADTVQSIADGVAALINQDATDKAIVAAEADELGNTIITALTKGATGEYTLSTAVTGAGHTTTATASGANLAAAGGTVVVQGQETVFTSGQVVSDPSMIGVVAQNLIPYSLQTPPLPGVRATNQAFPPP